MGNAEIIALVVVAVVIGLATFYILKTKKGQRKCIGCPSRGECNKKSKDNKVCACCQQNKTKEKEN